MQDERVDFHCGTLVGIGAVSLGAAASGSRSQHGKRQTFTAAVILKNAEKLLTTTLNPLSLASTLITDSEKYFERSIQASKINASIKLTQGRRLKTDKEEIRAGLKRA